MTQMDVFTIGQFSKKTGVAIATLRYYDEIGLLQPVKHPTSGHRSYTMDDAVLLQKILSLKFLGYSLEAIQAELHKTQFTVDMNESLALHLRALQQEQQLAQSIASIERIMALVEKQQTVSSDILFSLIHGMRVERLQEEWLVQHDLGNVTAALVQKTNEHKQALDENFVAVAQDVKRLYGKPVDDPEVQDMVQRYMANIFAFLGDDLIEQLANTNVDELDMSALEQTAPTPFSKEEEEWFNEAMMYAALQGEQ